MKFSYSGISLTADFQGYFICAGGKKAVLKGRRQWHPIPILLPGKSHGRRSLMGCSPWGRRVGRDFTFTLHFHALEKEMATHSSVLAWRIPGTGEPREGLSRVFSNTTVQKHQFFGTQLSSQSNSHIHT